MEAAPAQPGGITLTFVATENYFNGDVNVEGLNSKTPPKPHQLVNASKLDLGELFSEDNVQRAVERMNKVMGDNGYYQSAITYELKPHEDTRQMDMVFHVTPGDLARVGTVKIEGDTGIRAGANPADHQAEAGREGEEREPDARPGTAAQALPEEPAPGSAGVAHRPRLSRRHQHAGLHLRSGTGLQGRHHHRGRKDQQRAN